MDRRASARNVCVLYYSVPLTTRSLSKCACMDLMRDGWTLGVTCTCRVSLFRRVLCFIEGAGTTPIAIDSNLGSLVSSRRVCRACIGISYGDCGPCESTSDVSDRAISPARGCVYGNSSLRYGIYHDL